MTEEHLSPQELRASIQQTFQFAEKIMKGEYQKEGHVDKESLDPSEVFSGPIIDLNDDSLTEREKMEAFHWMEQRLEAFLPEAEVRNILISPDGQTEVTIYAKKFGSDDDPWFLSKWLNQGQKESFILWSQEFYEANVEEAGFQNIDEEVSDND